MELRAGCAAMAGGDTPPVGVPGDYLKQFPVVEIRIRPDARSWALRLGYGFM
jgi:hypothetical protein